MKPFTNLFQRRWALWLAAAVLLGGAAGAPAQQGVGDIVYTVGTTARDGAGRDWAYLLWQATSPNLLTGRVFAVYAKVGDATNPAPYLRQSIMRLQTDPRLIEPLLRRSQNVGESPIQLQIDMEQIFGALMPTNTIDRAQRLSAVIRGSLQDPGHYQNLILLARNHPGVSLCLGQAAAEMIGPGRTTFEIRAYDPVMDNDLAVIGRVTVQAGAPTILPRPGPPVLVPDQSPRGDLNVKLRWGTPDDLRRLSLMQFGFNLFRVTKAYAEAHNWHLAPPPLAALTNLVTTQPATAKRVNRIPILPSKQFTLPDAALLVAPGDPKTLFIADDDGRYKTNYFNYGFTNGAQFYYFVTARDVLGRDGDVSPGLLTTVCDRMPPFPPMGVKVANDYSYNGGAAKQVLRVNWNQVTNFNWLFSTNAGTGQVVSNKSETVVNYWIYRWSSVTQMNYLAGNISNHLIAVVPHLPGVLTNGYLDDGAGSPSVPADWNKTFWYTVRAGDAGACGQNLSGNSGPAFGVLRDRVGPDGPIGMIEINCVRPQVQYTPPPKTFQRSPNTNYYMYQLVCQRHHPQILWAEFYVYDQKNGTNIFLGRTFYGDGQDFVEWWYGWDPQQLSSTPLFWCRVGAANGKTSDFAATPTLRSETRQTYLQVIFDAWMQGSRTIASRLPQDCWSHDPRDPGTGLLTNIIISVLPTPTSREYRIYRRVDDGPLIMTCEGEITNVASIITCLEDSPPVNGGTVCFFVQLFDEHGNPSPMVKLGCIQVAPVTDLPVPVLAPIMPLGHTNNPGMNLVWFCPPYGVDRFEVWVGALPTAPDTNGNNLSTYLSYSNWPPSSITVSNKGIVTNFNFYIFRTPHVGPGFGGGGAQFVLPANIQIGKTYAVFVKALGPDGTVGKAGNVETFLWAPTNGPTITVPWPARPLPATTPNFIGLAAYLDPDSPSQVLQATTVGNGVLVGFGHVASRVVGGKERAQFQMIGLYDPNTWFLTNAAGAPLFPVALYRYQTPNAKYPFVSGDVTQVSPLMEQIAFGTNGVPGQIVYTVLYDPFMTATAVSDGNGGNYVYLWLRDTQPQISGARYKYLLVRFKPDREIDQIVPTTEVEVP